MLTSCRNLVVGLNRYAGLAAALLLCAIALPAPSAHAQQTVSPTEQIRWKAKITEIKTIPTAAPGIPILTWTPEEIWVESQGPVQYARIKWAISQPYASVSINGKKLTPKSDGTFDINFGFTNNEKAYKIVVVDQAGKTYQGSYKLLSAAGQQGPPKRVLQSRFRYSAGLGITSLKYEQTNVESFNEFALTVKGGVSYRLIPDRLDASLSGFMNAFVLKSTSAYSIRYLGVNARVGYHLVRAPSPLRLVMNAGLYYNTSFANVTLGFSNMYGPQLYPELSYIFSNGRAILLYAKYSPALFQGSIDFSSNREVATGLYYLFPLSAKYRMAIGFDVSNLQLSTGTDAAATTTYSLSTGISF